MFPWFLTMFGPKDSINTDVFADLEGQKHGIYDVFALWHQKPRYLFTVFLRTTTIQKTLVEGSLEVKLPTIWTDGQSRDGESQRRESEKEEDQRRERVRRKKMQVASSTSKGCRPCRQPRKKRHVAGVKNWHCLPHLILQPASPQSTGWAVCLCDASETATHHQFVVVVVGGGGGVFLLLHRQKPVISNPWRAPPCISRGRRIPCSQPLLSSCVCVFLVPLSSSCLLFVLALTARFFLLFCSLLTLAASLSFSFLFPFFSCSPLAPCFLLVSPSFLCPVCLLSPLSSCCLLASCPCNFLFAISCLLRPCSLFTTFAFSSLCVFLLPLASSCLLTFLLLRLAFTCLLLAFLLLLLFLR